MHGAPVIRPEYWVGLKKTVPQGVKPVPSSSQYGRAGAVPITKQIKLTHDPTDRTDRLPDPGLGWPGYWTVTCMVNGRDIWLALP